MSVFPQFQQFTDWILHAFQVHIHDKWWFNEFHFNYFMHDYHWIQIICRLLVCNATNIILCMLLIKKRLDLNIYEVLKIFSTFYVISSLVTRTIKSAAITFQFAVKIYFFSIGIPNGIYEDFNVTPSPLTRLTVWQITSFIFNFLLFHFSFLFIFTKYIHHLCKSYMMKHQCYQYRQKKRYFTWDPFQYSK